MHALNIYDISTYHQRLVVAVVAFIGCAFFISQYPLLLICPLLIAWATLPYFCFKLAAALGNPPLPWAFAGFVGVIFACVPHFLLINQANRLFKARGLKIGILGGIDFGSR